MPRPEKQRRVCFLPQYTDFSAKNGSDAVSVTLTIEEYEAIRLIDYLGFTQEMCAAKMNISRGVVQRLYFDARRKLAQFLIDGLPLRITGGNYALCDGLIHCGMTQLEERAGATTPFGEKARIIIPEPAAKNTDIDFADADTFRCYEIQQDTIAKTRRLKLNAKNMTHLILALLKEKINVVFAFRMGTGYCNALKEAGILVFLGLSGSPDDLVQNFLSNRIACNSIVNCRYRSTDEAIEKKHAPCARFGGYCLLK